MRPTSIYVANTIIDLFVTVPICGRNDGCCSLCTVSTWYYYPPGWFYVSQQLRRLLLSSRRVYTKRSLSARLLLDFYYFSKSCLSLSAQKVARTLILTNLTRSPSFCFSYFAFNIFRLFHGKWRERMPKHWRNTKVDGLPSLFIQGIKM